MTFPAPSPNRTVFDCDDYRDYLSSVLPTTGALRGRRSQLATYLGCQSAFVSRVLGGIAHFSLEHTVRIATFLALGPTEERYFLLLAHLNRAGSKDLETYYRRQLEAILRERDRVSERIPAKRELSLDDQAKYYGAWYYAAIHILLLIPAYRTVPAIADRLRIPAPLVASSLDFLVSCGLAKQKGAEFLSTEHRVHLAADSPMINRHHANWRVRTLEGLDRATAASLHYSGPMSLSRDDFRKIRETLLSTIERLEPVIRASKDESLYCLAMDFFEL